MDFQGLTNGCKRDTGGEFVVILRFEYSGECGSRQ